MYILMLLILLEQACGSSYFLHGSRDLGVLLSLMEARQTVLNSLVFTFLSLAYGFSVQNLPCSLDMIMAFM